MALSSQTALCGGTTFCADAVLTAVETLFPGSITFGSVHNAALTSLFGLVTTLVSFSCGVSFRPGGVSFLSAAAAVTLLSGFGGV